MRVHGLSTLKNLLVGALLVSAISAFASPSASTKVLAKSPQWLSDAQAFEAVGTGWADQSANLYPVVQEKVTRVFFKAQQKVERNQLLVQLENREEILALKLAQSQLKNAQSLLKRYLQAVEQGAVPQTQVDQAKADLEAAEVAVERAKLDLEDRQIRAPFAGIVGIPQVDKGQRVGPSNMVTGLDSREVIYVDIEIPEQLTPKLTSNSKNPIEMTAFTPALPGLQFTAKVQGLENRLNASTRTLRVRTQIDNKDDQLRPGMSFTIVWNIKGEPRPAVDEIALQWSRDGSYVWAVREGKATQVPVRVVSRQQGKVLLEGELSKDDQIIIEGIQRVRNGTSVELITSPES